MVPYVLRKTEGGTYIIATDPPEQLTETSCYGVAVFPLVGIVLQVEQQERDPPSSIRPIRASPGNRNGPSSMLRTPLEPAEPATDDVDFDAGLQEVHRGGMPEEMRRHMSGLWTAGIPGSGVTPDDLVDSETREGETAPRAKDWLVWCRTLFDEEPLEMSYRLIPQRTDVPLRA